MHYPDNLFNNKLSLFDIVSTSSPISFNKSKVLPCETNRSSIPSVFIGIEYACWAANSSTALPTPPFLIPSSKIITAL